MATNPTLGRLERVALREAWVSEAADFTPWLAQSGNIKLLGEAIELELEVEAQEKHVGPFRADILCKDTATDHWVLIENQLERTDHVHLGQLLTYAAGLEAVTIVWIAARFSDEHRATLDWLNYITNSTFNFFGIEVELWRIGDSQMAPKFNIVSKPNDWTESVKQSAAAAQSPEASQTQQLHLAFWAQFRQYMQDQGSKLSIQSPQPQTWTNIAVGRTGFVIVCVNNTLAHSSRVGFEIWVPNSQAILNGIREQFEERLETLRASLQPPTELQWVVRNKSAYVDLRRPSKVEDETTWPELNEWMRQAAEGLHAIFSPAVKSLDVNAPLLPAHGDTPSV